VLLKAEQRLRRSINYTLMNRAEFARRSKERGGFLDRILHDSRIELTGGRDEEV
jgi:hypothetical protein